MRFHGPIVTASAALALIAAGGLVSTASAATNALPALTVTMTNSSITTSSGLTVHAGRTQIHVVATDGEHDLQVLKLARGYSFEQASADFQNLSNGDVATVRRVDKNIRFLGGTAATPGSPGLFAETLYAGSYMLVDTNGTAHSALRVVGSPPRRQAQTAAGHRSRWQGNQRAASAWSPA